MKKLMMCLVFTFCCSCGVLQSLAIDEGNLLKSKELTHRIAVKGNIKIAKLSLEQGYPVSMHEQDLESDVSGGFTYGYGMSGYGMNSPAAYADSVSRGQGGSENSGQPAPIVVQTIIPAADTVSPPAQCPKGVVARNDAERTACNTQDQKVLTKRLHKQELHRH